MAELKNEFSWSKSRHDLFVSCRRKYFFHYYGSWNGWKREADERTRQIYYLKKLQSRQMWIGSVVHKYIENLLKTYRSGETACDQGRWEANLLSTLRQEFVLSRSGNWSAMKWRLFEHEYETDVTDEEWKRTADLAVACFRTFMASPLHERVRALAPDQYLEIEDFSHFFIDGVKVHVVLDFSFRENGDVFIYDWKTGQGEGGMHALQLACYRAYAQQKWDLPEENIFAVEFNLARNETTEYRGSVGLRRDEALEQIRSSIRGMQERLADVAGNTAREEDFSFVDNEKSCFTCNFQRVCPKRQPSS